MATILTVDDESGIRAFLAEALAEAGHDVAEASDAQDAVQQLEDRPFDLMFLDLRMPGAATGMDVLRRARAEWPAMQVIVLTAHGSVGNAVEALKLGAFDFLEKPLESPAALRRIVKRALNWRVSGAARSAAVPRTPPPTIPSVARAEPLGSTSAFGRGLLWQLKRRHVYNVAASYVAFGFIALQAAELILPVVPVVPEWSYPVLVGLVIAGFPVAVALGWIYDISASGLRRTESSTDEVNL